MIRRTVARAFGMSGEDRPRPEKAAGPAKPTSRIGLLNALFTELQEAFERSLREAPGAAGGAASAAVQVSKARPRPEGLEFLVEGPGGSFRFLNAMDGIAWIFRNEGGRFVEERLLSIQFEADRPRAIEKPVGLSRSPFRLTSVPGIVREFVGRAGGSRRVEASPAPP